MSHSNIKEIIAEICLYLHDVDNTFSTSKVIDLVRTLSDNADTDKLVDECHELRCNVISFKIREVQTRINENTTFINACRFSNMGDKNEVIQLEVLYTQAKLFNDKLTIYRKLDLLLLQVTTLLKKP